MGLLAGGLLKSFSIIALGISPYITSQIVIQLLSQDVLRTLTELNEKGEEGLIQKEKLTRFLIILLGSFQAYGTIRTLDSQGYIEIYIKKTFWKYFFNITCILAGSMLLFSYLNRLLQKVLIMIFLF